MKVKDIKKYHNELFKIMMKNEEVQKEFEKTTRNCLFLYEIFEGSKHEFVFFDYETQIPGYLKENDYKNPLVKLYFTIDRQTKQVY